MPRFKDIRGQNAAHEVLIRAATRGRLPHALLFHGASGVGKTTTAFALAQYVNCADPTDADSCGACPSCKKIDRMRHPDLHWIFPMAGSLKGEKRAAHIRKTMDERLEPGIHSLSFPGAASIAIGRDEDTRAGSVGELRHRAGYAPMEAAVKAFIISDAGRMRQEAANSLLKVLEEPPPDNLLVLVARRPAELLETIVSRCQSVRFRDLSEAEVSGLLAGHLEVDEAEAALAAALAGGSLTRAADLVGGDVVEARDRALAFLRLRPGDPRLHEAVADIAKEKDRSVVERILDFGLLWLSDLLRASSGSDVPLANRDLEDEIRRAATSFSVAEIRRRAGIIQETREAMAGNVYLPLVLYQLAEGLEAPPSTVGAAEQR